MPLKNSISEFEIWSYPKEFANMGANAAVQVLTFWGKTASLVTSSQPIQAL